MAIPGHRDCDGMSVNLIIGCKMLQYSMPRYEETSLPSLLPALRPPEDKCQYQDAPSPFQVDSETQAEAATVQSNLPSGKDTYSVAEKLSL